jgi:hypothetical protein
MSQGREPSHPPSDPQHPHTGATRGRGAFAAEDRPVRIQLVAALILGLLLVASGLYLWRRPHATGDGTATESTAPDAEVEDAGTVVVVVDAAPAPVSISEARILGCHDRGAKVTPAEECDRLAPVEQALTHAIEQSAACFPPTGDGATIEYVADVSFSRHKVRVTTPRTGRSEHDRKVVSGCGTAIREAMHALELEGIEHHHARYEIAVTASYRGHG